MGSCDVKKHVRFAVFPYVVEIPPRGPEWDEDEEEGFFSGEEEWEEEESDFVEPVKGNFVWCYVGVYRFFLVKLNPFDINSGNKFTEI